MSIALKPTVNLLNPESFFPVREALSRAYVNDNSDYFFRARRLTSLDKPKGFSRRDYAILGVLVVVAHAAAVSAYLRFHNETVLIPEKKNEVLVEFIRPEPPPPPPKIEPPKPVPPKPEIKKAIPPPPKPAPVLKTREAEPDIKPDDMTVKENTQAQHTPVPVVAEPTPPPAPPVVKEEPVTEASGYAGYLNNPPPEYPAFAQRQGWEGKVVLRVRVLASGKAGNVELKQSSGRKTLDEAAIEVVKGWTFAPAKRGSTAIDGWATVPIEFKLAK